MQSVRFLFSHAWRESGQVTPACGHCSSPPLFAVAAIKMSLSLRCEVQRQEAKCSALGPICLRAACKVERLKTQFPGAVIADVALCQLWWEQVVASVRGLCFLVWLGDWGTDELPVNNDLSLTPASWWVQPWVRLCSNTHSAKLI